jgi:hypothetical protein
MGETKVTISEGDPESRVTLLRMGSSVERGKEGAESERPLYILRLWSALFYAIASFLITVVNKLVLTSSG